MMMNPMVEVDPSIWDPQADEQEVIDAEKVSESLDELIEAQALDFGYECFENVGQALARNLRQAAEMRIWREPSTQWHVQQTEAYSARMVQQQQRAVLVEDQLQATEVQSAQMQPVPVEPSPPAEPVRHPHEPQEQGIRKELRYVSREEDASKAIATLGPGSDNLKTMFERLSALKDDKEFLAVSRDSTKMDAVFDAIDRGLRVQYRLHGVNGALVANCDGDIESTWHVTEQALYGILAMFELVVRDDQLIHTHLKRSRLRSVFSYLRDLVVDILIPLAEDSDVGTPLEKPAIDCWNRALSKVADIMAKIWQLFRLSGVLLEMNEFLPGILIKVIVMQKLPASPIDDKLISRLQGLAVHILSEFGSASAVDIEAARALIGGVLMESNHLGVAPERRFRLNDTTKITATSAFFMKIIEKSCVPRGGGSDGKPQFEDPAEEPSELIQQRRAQECSAATINNWQLIKQVLEYFLHQALGNKDGEKRKDNQYRGVLKILVEDFVNAIYEPSFPSAGTLVSYTFDRVMIYLSEDRYGADVLQVEIIRTIVLALGELEGRLYSSPLNFYGGAWSKAQAMHMTEMMKMVATTTQSIYLTTVYYALLWLQLQSKNSEKDVLAGALDDLGRVLEVQQSHQRTRRYKEEAARILTLGQTSNSNKNNGVYSKNSQLIEQYKETLLCQKVGFVYSVALEKIKDLVMETDHGHKKRPKVIKAALINMFNSMAEQRPRIIEQYPMLTKQCLQDISANVRRSAIGLVESQAMKEIKSRGELSDDILKLIDDVCVLARDKSSPIVQKTACKMLSKLKIKQLDKRGHVLATLLLAPDINPEDVLDSIFGAIELPAKPKETVGELGTGQQQRTLMQQQNAAKTVELLGHIWKWLVNENQEDSLERLILQATGGESSSSPTAKVYDVQAIVSRLVELIQKDVTNDENPAVLAAFVKAQPKLIKLDELSTLMRIVNDFSHTRLHYLLEIFAHGLRSKAFTETFRREMGQTVFKVFARGHLNRRDINLLGTCFTMLLCRDQFALLVITVNRFIKRPKKYAKELEGTDATTSRDTSNSKNTEGELVSLLTVATQIVRLCNSDAATRLSGVVLQDRFDDGLVRELVLTAYQLCFKSPEDMSYLSSGCLHCIGALLSVSSEIVAEPLTRCMERALMSNREHVQLAVVEVLSELMDESNRRPRQTDAANERQVKMEQIRQLAATATSASRQMSSPLEAGGSPDGKQTAAGRTSSMPPTPSKASLKNAGQGHLSGRQDSAPAIADNVSIQLVRRAISHLLEYCKSQNEKLAIAATLLVEQAVMSGAVEPITILATMIGLQVSPIGRVRAVARSALEQATIKAAGGRGSSWRDSTVIHGIRIAAEYHQSFKRGPSHEGSCQNLLGDIYGYLVESVKGEIQRAKTLEAIIETLDFVAEEYVSEEAARQHEAYVDFVTRGLADIVYASSIELDKVLYKLDKLTGSTGVAVSEIAEKFHNNKMELDKLSAEAKQVLHYRSGAVLMWIRVRAYLMTVYNVSDTTVVGHNRRLMRVSEKRYDDRLPLFLVDRLRMLTDKILNDESFLPPRKRMRHA